MAFNRARQTERDTCELLGLAKGHLGLADQDSAFAQSRRKPDSYFDWNGGSWGIQATLLFEPYRDITIIVLTNGSNVGPDSHDIARDLLSAARRTR